ncbi:YfjI family protein [Methylotenera sp.]|uniref:YfjI family protein n=2 Tax=Methylotenera sp. TaxID=2051956 RepID=UPI00272F4A10|nr:YfjI family protein [Methylotenera sp.]MDP2230321.1 YfjI family protein [Methylotenera sp.]MDP3142302.1 YfjI family protein [Methylotenera sp.]
MQFTTNEGYSDDVFKNCSSTPPASEWLKPVSLLQESEPPQYPLESLPSGLGDAVREVIEFVQCPMALAACSALSALSVSAQHLANVRRAEGLEGPVSLYILAIAESGERKSSVDKHFTTAITAWEAKQAELAKPNVKSYQVKHDSWSMQYEGLKQKIKETAKQQKPVDDLTSKLMQLKNDEPLPVRVPRLIFGDATPEQLGYALAKNWPSAGVLSSEAGIVFGSHGMSGDSAMRNMALLNVLWDGGTHTIDRRTTDSYKIKDARLTMGLAVQADTVRAFYDNSKGLARGTGFLARYLIACPDSTQGSRLFKEPPTAWPNLTVFSDRITELLNKLPKFNEAGGIIPTTLDFSNDAKKAWITFHNDVELELKQGGDLTDAKDVASKAADNVARLAALFHLYEWGSEGRINKDLVVRASAIVKWHLYEAKRFLNQIAIPAHISNAIKIDDYILRYCRDHKSDRLARNYLRQHGAIRDKKLLNDALDELKDANRIKIRLDDRTSIIEVNPALLVGDYA